MATQIQTRRGTAATWTSTNPILALGEMGLETDTRKFKFGDGVTAWASLSYAGGAVDSAALAALATADPAGFKAVLVSLGVILNA